MDRLYNIFYIYKQDGVYNGQIIKIWAESASEAKEVVIKTHKYFHENAEDIDDWNIKRIEIIENDETKGTTREQWTAIIKEMNNES